MTAEERQASLQRIIDAARNVVRTVQEETQRAAELVDDAEPTADCWSCCAAPRI